MRAGHWPCSIFFDGLAREAHPEAREIVERDQPSRRTDAQHRKDDRRQQAWSRPASARRCGTRGAPGSVPGAPSPRPARHAPRQHREQHDPPDQEVDRDRRRAQRASGLLELDQRAAEVLGVQEQHRLVVGADLRLAVAEHARALAPSAGRARRGCRPPRSRRGGCRRRDCAPGTWRSANSAPSGSSSSILVFGSVMNTVVTPCAGCGTAADTSAPSVLR